MRAWRDAEGLTQEEAARKLGVAREWLSKIENNKTPVSAELYLKLQALQREDDFTRRQASQPKVTDVPAGYQSSPVDTLKGEIENELERLRASAGDDIGRLGWLRQELRVLNARAHLTSDDVNRAGREHANKIWAGVKKAADAGSEDDARGTGTR